MDCIVVGCGFAGSVIARHLAEKHNKKVTIFERRNHIAGNMYDYVNEYGIRIHKYGPHTFHTSSKKLYEYVCRYSKWDKFTLTCMVFMEKRFTPSPFNFQTIDDYYSPQKAKKIKEVIKSTYPNSTKATIVEMLESSNTIIKEYADFLYNKDYSLYTAKQWGISPTEVDISVLGRVPVRFSYKRGYFDDRYQIMPVNGYTGFFSRLLDHPNIQLQLNMEARDFLSIDEAKKTVLFNKKPIQSPVIYTGAIDELMECKYGELPYRSLRFEIKNIPVESFQEAPIVAYPQADDFTRITEYKKLPTQKANGHTTVAVEYPLQHITGKGMEPYYPVPNDENLAKYNLYLNKLKDIHNLFLCGRLAEYKYYNMDQVLERALMLCDELDKFYKAQ